MSTDYTAAEAAEALREAVEGQFGDVVDPNWRDLALCAETDPETFFPERGGSTRPAKQVCAGCEVLAECREYALQHHELIGVWGGLSESERRTKRRAQGQDWSAA